MPQLIILLGLISIYSQVSAESVYHDNGGPANWPNLYKDCGGKHQSPIALPAVSSASCKHNFSNFKRSDTTSKTPQSITVYRTEESVYVIPVFGSGENINISGGPLRGTYILQQIHFHWGTKNVYGSEHTINGIVYSMELHAVHYNSKYSSFQDAQTKSDGLAVVGILYKVVPTTTSPAMDALTSSFKYIQQKGVNTTTVQNPFPIDKLVPSFQNNYLTYNGSLTTPPCYETVTWIVYGSPLEISGKNIARFRAFYNVDPELKNNFRPLQPLNDRVVVAKST